MMKVNCDIPIAPSAGFERPQQRCNGGLKEEVLLFRRYRLSSAVSSCLPGLRD